MDMLTVMKLAARAAGSEIMQVYRSDYEVYVKDDASPVTEADLRADKVIRAELSKHFPNTYIWSEESVSQGGCRAPGFFLVDPLDGTKEFLKRNGEFTVNIAYIVEGQVQAAVVFVPVLDEMFYASKGQGAWLEAAGQCTKLHVAVPSSSDRLQILGSRSHASAETDAWLAQFNRPYDLIAAGSSLKFCRLAQGRAHLYPRFGPTCQWDTAAGQGLLEQAGGMVVTLENKPLTYGLDRETINPNFVATASLALLGK